MSYYRSMPISQLIAGLNDANMEVEAGRMSDEDMDALTDRLTAEVQMLTSLDDERHRISEEGIGQQDLVKLENICPGVTAGLNSGDYTFLASQHGLEPALNAIDWKTMGKWGIIGAIIAAIIALIVKIRGGKGKGAAEKSASVKKAKAFILNGDEEIKENITSYIQNAHTKHHKLKGGKKPRELTPEEIAKIQNALLSKFDEYTKPVLDILVKEKTIAQIGLNKGEMGYVVESLAKVTLHDILNNEDFKKKVYFGLELYSKKQGLMLYSARKEIASQVNASCGAVKETIPVVGVLSKLCDSALSSAKSQESAETWIKNAQNCITSMEGIISKYEKSFVRDPLADLKEVTFDHKGDLKPVPFTVFSTPSQHMDLTVATEIGKYVNDVESDISKVADLSDSLTKEGKSTEEELNKINTEEAKKIKAVYSKLSTIYLKLVQLSFKGIRAAALYEDSATVFNTGIAQFTSRSLAIVNFIVAAAYEFY